MAAAAAAVLRGLPVMAIDIIYHVASTRVGQHALSFVDRILCIVEALNFYAAPLSQQQEARRELKEVQDYQRPLPWILFIPMLFYFRIVRTALSVIAFFIGLPSVSPILVVYYVQSYRRKLRYIKIQGARLMSGDSAQVSPLPWFVRWPVNVFTYGPLQFLTILARLVLGQKQYHVYTAAASGQRMKRSLQKSKSTGNSDECSTTDLLDKYADEDDNDPANDPDFEVKATDLVSETEEELDEGENTDAETDGQPGNGEIKEGEQENQQNSEHNNAHGEEHNNHNENKNNNNHHHQHHEEHHHHY